MEEHRIADRYLMGQLDETERRSFEEHFLDCAVCLETLEAIEGLREGLRERNTAARSFAAPMAPAGPAGRFSGSRARPFVVFLAAACLLVTTAASLYFFGEARRARRELAAGRQASERSRQREADLGRALEKERASRIRPGPTEDIATSFVRAAPVAAAVFTLNLTRGASIDPSDRVSLPPPPGWIVLLFDRPDRPGIGPFRVRVETAGGRSVAGPVSAGAASEGMLAVSLPPGLLSPGDYRLAVEDAGSGDVVATYRFRAVPQH